MPRGRKVKIKENIMADIMAGPIETIVAEPKKVTYQRVLFRNLQDQNVNLEFTFNGLSYCLIDGEEVDLRKEIVDHLNSRNILGLKYVKDANGNSVKQSTLRPRFMLNILKTYEK